MVKVVADSRGFFGGILREAGHIFDLPDELWHDKKRRPSWVREKKAAAADAPAPQVDAGGGIAVKLTVPIDWQNLPAAERKILAKAISGQDAKNVGDADTVIAAFVEANKPEPFADAPAPQTVEPVRATNEINAATGATQPDWVAPSAAPATPSGAPTPVAD